ncbi:MAG: chorismate-binding protein [Bacteroidota bacterium]|nr:chorismate-binding protein [Bacteroidota bacterium]
MKTITTRSLTMLADTQTPVSVYLKIRDVFPGSVLLESSDFHHLDNCYSFIGIKPVAGFTVYKEKIAIKVQNQEEEIKIDQPKQAVDQLNEFFQSFQNSNSEFFFNGFFGYISYEAVQYFETIKLKNRPDESSIPALHFSLFQYIIAFNHFKNEITIIENLLPGEKSSLQSIQAIINQGKISNYPFQVTGKESTNMSDLEYINKVKNAKAHCMRGDVFQLVLSRRFSQKFLGDDFNVYRQLRSLNPSPYLFYFDFGNFRLFGSSPESQIEIKNNKAYINPIAGTYERTGNDIEDKKLSEELSKDIKENAEHIMLVDLARNDLSKTTRNVKVENFKELHFYSHVIHIVSKVSGELDQSSDKVKIITDTFPAGTLTGAPKYKAMQLIDTYEPNERGFYGGCIGFIGFNGNINMAITIRTFLSKNNTLYYQAGAGIVSKSDKNKELQEVNHKLGALKLAVKKANSQHKPENIIKHVKSISKN